MKKIAIFGPPASGKSTAATRLGREFNIPVYYLDQYRWQQGWKKRPKEEFMAMHEALCEQEEWVIEGVYSSTYEQRAQSADALIYIALPRYKYLWNLLKRFLFGSSKTIVGYARNCKPRLDKKFIEYCWNFNKKHQPTISALLAQHQESKKIYIVRSHSEAEKLVQKIKQETMQL